MKKQPQHVNPTRDERIAHAPYNFVPLPDAVLSRQDTLPPHNSYQDRDGLHTGHLECTLTTETPLYVRGLLSLSEFERGEKEQRTGDDSQDFRNLVKNKPDFFHYETDPQSSAPIPIIPGSSLRGMLRSLVEIAAFGKITRVTERQRYFFRAVAAEKDDPLATPYKSNLSNVCAGYLVHEGNNWYIQPVQSLGRETFIKVRERDIPSTLGLVRFNDSDYRPQYIQVSFTTKQTPKRRTVVDKIGLPGKFEHEGWLVTSGNMLETGGSNSKSHRKNHCVVVSPSNTSRIKIDVNAIEDYRNSLTDFQKQPPFDANWGMLKHERPVFYLPPKKGQDIRMFGQSPNFRVPYIPPRKDRAASPHDFIPDALKSPDTVDLAEAIFGFVRDDKQKDDKQQTRAGRVFVGDATLDDPQQREVWLRDKPLIPSILATPKPTTFQHYLVQPEDDKQKLRHYASKVGGEDGTLIRGHKLYWHQGDVDVTHIEDKEFPKKTAEEQRSDTQHTQFRPVASGVSFTFTIHFENLTDEELGALLWVLHVASHPDYRLKLGMGKPLGMGSVQITHTMHLTDRKARYEQLLDDTGQWETGAKGTEDVATTTRMALATFERAILTQPVLNDVNATRLHELPRIQMLLRLLHWQPGSIYPRKSSNYMRLDQFRGRPVLPVPQGVLPEIPSDPLDGLVSAEDVASCTTTSYTVVSGAEPVEQHASDVVRVETRRRGRVVTVASGEQPGEIEDDDEERHYLYADSDVVGEELPTEEQSVLFKPERHKVTVKRGKKKYVPWAEDVEVV